MMALVVGTTETAAIDGLSAAGADPDAMRWTPAADAELLAHGAVVRMPAVPVSPSGCPTPALITRAVRETVGFDVCTLDTGLSATPAVPTVSLGSEPGRDIREDVAVPDAGTLWRRAETFAAAFEGERLVLAESVPGGTTTALAVCQALGEDVAVSSSLADNPTDSKQAVVRAALTASALEPGDLAGQPIAAIEAVGDPVLAALAGAAAGGLGSDTEVVLAGGTQQLAVAALLRHAGIETPLAVATTPFVADDPTANVTEAAATLDVELTVTDPGFDADEHVVFERYLAGEAKEGAGMGGALALAARDGVSMAAIRERITAVYENI